MKEKKKTKKFINSPNSIQFDQRTTKTVWILLKWNEFSFGPFHRPEPIIALFAKQFDAIFYQTKIHNVLRSTSTLSTTSTTSKMFHSSCLHVIFMLYPNRSIDTQIQRLSEWKSTENKTLFLPFRNFIFAVAFISFSLLISANESDFTSGRI